MNNTMEVMKNEIFTNIAYEVIFKYVIPKIIYNFVPYGKFFAPFIPAGVETAESLTSGLKEGDVINMDNVTVGNFARIAGDGFFHAVLVTNFGFGNFGKLLKDIPMPNGLDNALLASQYKMLYRGVRCFAIGSSIATGEYIISSCGDVLHKDASTWDIVKSVSCNLATGGAFIWTGFFN